MTEEKLNQVEDIFEDEIQEEEIQEDETNKGDESEEKKEQESDQEFIDRVNKETGKNFKSIEAIAKSLKQMDKDFAEKGKQTKAEIKSESELTDKEEISEELLLTKYPEAETVLDDVKKIANLNYGGNLAKAYREEEWLQEKASKEMQKEENIKKIKSPSNSVRKVEPEVKVTDEDKRIADKYFGGDISRYLKNKAKI